MIIYKWYPIDPKLFHDMLSDKSQVNQRKVYYTVYIDSKPLSNGTKKCECVWMEVGRRVRGGEIASTQFPYTYLKWVIEREKSPNSPNVNRTKSIMKPNKI